jgi:hypothetical protein
MILEHACLSRIRTKRRIAKPAAYQHSPLFTRSVCDRLLGDDKSASTVKTSVFSMLDFRSSADSDVERPGCPRGGVRMSCAGATESGDGDDRIADAGRADAVRHAYGGP